MEEISSCAGYASLYYGHWYWLESGGWHGKEDDKAGRLDQKNEGYKKSEAGEKGEEQIFSAGLSHQNGQAWHAGHAEEIRAIARATADEQRQWCGD
jgi:hypothetical protein